MSKHDSGQTTADTSRPLVGRRAEEARIAHALETARRGRASLLSIVGGPGVGKTALCHRAVRVAHGMRVVRVTPAESEQSLPLLVLADIVARLHDIQERLDDRSGQVLSSLVSRSAPETTDLLSVGAALLQLFSTA